MKLQKFLITTLAIILLGCEKTNTHAKFETFKKNSETEITYTPASQSNYYLALAFPSQQTSRTSYSNDFSCTDQELEIEVISDNSKKHKKNNIPHHGRKWRMGLRHRHRSCLLQKNNGHPHDKTALHNKSKNIESRIMPHTKQSIYNSNQARPQNIIQTTKTPHIKQR